MRISDWSSDVCSSDLVVLRGDLPAQRDDVFPHDPKADAEMGLGNGVAVDRGGHLRAVGIVPVEDALQPPRLDAGPVVPDRKFRGGAVALPRNRDLVAGGEMGRAPCRERGGPYV